MGCAGSSQKQDTPAHGGGGADEEEEQYNPLTEDEVNARIVCSTKAEKFPLGDSGITLRYAYLSQRGYYPEDLYKANQDSFKVVPKFNGLKEQILFGVFDGHGVDGDSCSYFVRDNIEQELKKQMLLYPEDFEKAYKESFIQVNQRMHDQVCPAARQWPPPWRRGAAPQATPRARSFFVAFHLWLCVSRASLPPAAVRVRA